MHDEQKPTRSSPSVTYPTKEQWFALGRTAIVPKAGVLARTSLLELGLWSQLNAGALRMFGGCASSGRAGRFVSGQ